MMTSSNRNSFRVTSHLCGKFTGHRWIPHTKATDAELWCLFVFICACINGWVNNGEAGDLRRHRSHYDVIVMLLEQHDYCNTQSHRLEIFGEYRHRSASSMSLWEVIQHEVILSDICTHETPRSQRPMINERPNVTLHNVFISQAWKLQWSVSFTTSKYSALPIYHGHLPPKNSIRATSVFLSVKCHGDISLLVLLRYMQYRGMLDCSISRPYSTTLIVMS